VKKDFTPIASSFFFAHRRQSFCGCFLLFYDKLYNIDEFMICQESP